MNTMNAFEELILAARDAKLPYSFYCNEANQAIFVVKHDRFGRELLLEVFTEKDLDGNATFWFRHGSRADCFDRPEYAVRAAAHYTIKEDY